MTSRDSLPILAITMGDAAGVGPEIIAMALNERAIFDICRPVVIGDLKIMQRALKITGSPASCRKIAKASEGGREFGVIDVLDLDNLPADMPFAVVDSRAGKAAFEYVSEAARLAIKGEIGGVVTAPLHKEALRMAGCGHAGHTEILAALAGVDDYAMMLVSGHLRVIHVTTHVSLRRACELITRKEVLRTILLADREVYRMIGAKPRIGVAGLNPHSGESGLFGTEEIEEIAPAVEDAKKQGALVFGPIAPDTIFYRTIAGREFDVVVCMYHDQGHIPLKASGFEGGVNVTVGLPFIRTSVDHGTAFDKAGKGTASCRSLVEAIRLAARMASVSLYATSEVVAK